MHKIKLIRRIQCVTQMEDLFEKGVIQTIKQAHIVIDIAAIPEEGSFIHCGKWKAGVAAIYYHYVKTEYSCVLTNDSRLIPHGIDVTGDQIRKLLNEYTDSGWTIIDPCDICNESW